MNCEEVTFATAQEEATYWRMKALEYKRSYEEAREELEEYQGSSRELEAELEAQLEQSEVRLSEARSQVSKLSMENDQLKEKVERQNGDYTKQMSDVTEQLDQINSLKDNLTRYVRTLEQSNDDLERAKRATVTSLEDFEAKLNQAIERNAFLESELDEKESLKIMVQRLKDEARDLRQEIIVKGKDEMEEPDNDKAILKNNSNSNHHIIHTTSPILQQSPLLSPTDHIIDSNKLICNTQIKDSLSIKATHSLHKINNGNIPMTPSARINALNIVGDLLRKVGALESRLASCRTLVKDQRPMSIPPAGNHSAR